MTDSDVEIVLTDAPDDAAREAIGGGLGGYNVQQAGYRDGRDLAVLLRERASGAVLGDVLGRTSLGLLFIDLFFLPETLRGQDLGSALLGQAEAEGLRRGCRNGFLYTLSFQAPGFYARHGWAEFGRIPCDPPGSARVFMRKALAPGGA
jgi:GNAT superfamily N-acetyltransferase